MPEIKDGFEPCIKDNSAVPYVVIWNHNAEYKEFEIPYKLGEDVWYCYKRWKKWVVRESSIGSVWASNISGVRLLNGWCVSSYDYYRLFKDKNSAIDWCVKQNQRSKVKVYGEYD